MSSPQAAGCCGNAGEEKGGSSRLNPTTASERGPSHLAPSLMAAAAIDLDFHIFPPWVFQGKEGKSYHGKTTACAPESRRGGVRLQGGSWRAARQAPSGWMVAASTEGFFIATRQNVNDVSACRNI